MSSAAFLSTLRGLGIRLSVDEDRLCISAPKGALTADLAEEIKTHKAEILEFLKATEHSSEIPELRQMPRDQPLPLSSFQERLWVLNRLDPKSTAYNLVAWKKCSLPLDMEAARESLTALVRRHEILRTNFQALEGVPKLLIHPPEPIDPPSQDWTDEEIPDLDDRLRSLANEEAQRPMDLAGGSLFRPGVVRTSSDSFAFLLTLHHIVTDAWSLGLVLAEWQALYEGALSGQSLVVPEPPLQYADYSAWQREVIAGEDHRDSESFWKKYLEGAPTVLTLHSDRPRGATQSFAGGIHLFEIGSEVGAKLKDLCLSEGVTPFMVWLATFGLLLSRYSGQRDLLIGTPVASRTLPVLESMLGPFVNTMVVRHQQAATDTGRMMLARTRESMLAAHAHQAVPFERLVEIIPADRTMAHPPLFQASCAFHNQPGRSEFTVTAGGSMFELTLNGFELGDQLAGSLEYNLALFDEATIQRMGTHFRTLLSSLVENPDALVGELPMVTDEELGIVVGNWNETQQDLEGEPIFIRSFETQASQTPERIAAVSGDDQLTYAELNERADVLAKRLLGEGGLQAGGTVALVLGRNLDLLVAPLAVMKAGGVYVPIDSEYPSARIEFILEDSGAGLLVTTESLAPRFTGTGIQTLLADSPVEPSVSGPVPEGPRDSNSLAYVIYTSGSTGKPKGVEISHGGLMNVLHSLRSEPGLESDDTMVAVTTFAFDISGVELFLPLLAGARVVIAPADVSEHGKRLLKLLDEVNATVLQATPATWQMLMDAGWTQDTANRSMRVWSGGEVLPRSLADALLDRSASVWNLYGPTETTIWSTLCEVTRDDGSVPIGKPLANTQAYVVDPFGSPTPIGIPGELLIGGAGVGHGYRNLPDLTKDRFISNPLHPSGKDRLYRTGDWVRWTSSGTLEYLGRIDQQVKVRGHRIELGEIESALLSNAVVQSAAAGVWESRIVAYLVFEEGQRATAADIRRSLRGQLPEYMIPGFVVELPELPMTENRKLDRKRLPSPQTAGGSLGAREFEPPKAGAELAVAEIWQDLLGADTRIGANDNFFELGGHSLLALQAVYRMEQLKGEPLDTRAIFFETLRQIAAR